MAFLECVSATSRGQRHFLRNSLMAAASCAVLALAGCQSTSNSILTPVDLAQGSSENISSLTTVIQSNPRNPESYNVRGSAYGKAGRYKEALKDFDTAIQLDPNYYQAYANRALIQRYQKNDAAAVQDYSRAIQINPQYDTAYIEIGRAHV